MMNVSNLHALHAFAQYLSVVCSRRLGKFLQVGISTCLYLYVIRCDFICEYCGKGFKPLLGFPLGEEEEFYFS